MKKQKEKQFNFITEIKKDADKDIYFQQDGAPPHNVLKVREW